MRGVEGWEDRQYGFLSEGRSRQNDDNDVGDHYDSNDGTWSDTTAKWMSFGGRGKIMKTWVRPEK